MTISFQCPQCSRKYQVGDEFAGKRVQCKCGQKLTVPAPSSPTDSAGPSAGGESDPLSDLFDEALPPPAIGPAAVGAAQGGPVVLPRAKRPQKKTGLSPAVLAAIIGGGIVVVLLIGLIGFLTLGGGASEEAGADASGQGEAASPDDGPSGFATPEEAFAALQKATLGKDWARVLAAHTPESQQRLVGAVASQATMFMKFAGRDAELAGLLKKHGLDESLLEAQPFDMKSVMASGDLAEMAQKMEQHQQKLVAAIKDRSAFFVEMTELLEKKGDEWAKNMPGASSLMRAAERSRAEAEKARAEAKLVDVEISGDTAQGKQQIRFRDRTMGLPVHFRRIDGRWYMHQPSVAEAAEEGFKIGQDIAQSMSEAAEGEGGLGEALGEALGQAFSQAMGEAAPSEAGPRIEIKAAIDGQDKLHIFPDRIEWEHASWNWPHNVTINGTPWDPEKTRVFRFDDELRTAMQGVNLRSYSMEKTRGRGKVHGQKGDGRPTIVIDDQELGADNYEVTVQFPGP